MLDALGGRKFLLTILVLIIGSIIQVYSPHGVTDSFSTLLIGVTAAFGATNAAVSWKALSKEQAETVAEQPVSVPPVDLSHIEQAVLQVNDVAANAVNQASQASQLATSQAEAIAKLQENQENATKLIKALMHLK